MKKLLVFLLAAMMAFSALPAMAETAEYKDTLIVGTYGDQDTLDPQVNVSNDKVLRLLYDGLLTHDNDGNIVAGLAESWEHSDDYLTWTFNLRKGVKFANGKELTSADVVATFNRLIDKDHPLRYSEKVEFIDSVEAIDDYTVQINCGYQYGIVEETLAMQCCFILDADYIEQYAYDIGIDINTISTLSAALPRFTAARMPNRMPNTVENSVDSTASLNVVGKRCVISYHTGLCVKIDVPRSPLSTLPSQTKYCCHIGLSRPRRIVSATRASCVAPRPRLTVTGSPGISRTITNTTMDSASSIGII